MKIIAMLSCLAYMMFSCGNGQSNVHRQLHSNCYEIKNQYFYGEKVRTYLLVLENQVLLFDIPTYSKNTEQFILSLKKPVIALLSHGSCGIADGSKWQARIGLKVYAHEEDRDHPWLRMKPDIYFTEMPHFGDSIKVIHTPGHSAGAVCLYDEASKSMFTGDTCYGNENGTIRDFTTEKAEAYENPADRIESCKKLIAYDFENMYPFHYEIIEGKSRTLLKDYLTTK